MAALGGVGGVVAGGWVGLAVGGVGRGAVGAIGILLEPLQPILAAAEQAVALCHALLRDAGDVLEVVVGIGRSVLTLVELYLLHQSRGEKTHECVEMGELGAVPLAVVVADVAVERVGMEGSGDLLLEQREAACGRFVLLAVARPFVGAHLLVGLGRTEAEETAV